MKSGILVLCYFIVRIGFRTIPFLDPVFKFFKGLLASVVLKISYGIISLFGYDVHLFRRIIWIEGSEGVKVINACLAWPIMAMFIGFIAIYPGDRKSKIWFIPTGLILIILMNALRITVMTLISYHNPDLIDFYHKYVFNAVLYMVIFILWTIWVLRYGDRRL